LLPRLLRRVQQHRRRSLALVVLRAQQRLAVQVAQVVRRQQPAWAARVQAWVVLLAVPVVRAQVRAALPRDEAAWAELPVADRCVARIARAWSSRGPGSSRLILAGAQIRSFRGRAG
jgi:hypothetical protein